MKLYNPFVMKAHAARTSAEDPLQKFKFRVTIPGIPGTIGFQKVSGLDMNINSVEYNESAYPYVHKLPGLVSFSEVTMERGMFEDTSMLDQMQEAWISKWESGDFDATSDDVAIETITVQYEYLL